MTKFWRFLKHEFFQLIGPTVFFFVAFNLIAFTKKLFLEDYHINFTGFLVTASFGALLVGKVVILADEIPLMNRFPPRPLIYNVVWKTAVYSLAALIVQFLEEFFPLLWHDHNPATAAARVWDEVHWPHFWAVHILLAYFLLIYVSFRELARNLGERKFCQIFFGVPKTLAPD